MPLAALIGAYHDSSEAGDGLRATLPVAGRTLIERQARLAADVGAHPVLIVVERETAELNAAILRLRGEGIDILVARGAGEAARAVQGSDSILLIADGLLPGADQVRLAAERQGAALLTVPDIRFDDRFERIDAQTRWAGLALIDGHMLKQTAAMLQDWDLQSTLLRRAVQAGATHVPVPTGPGDTPLILAERNADLADLEGRILESANAMQRDWVSRYLLAPLEQAATRRLMPTPAAPAHLWLGALALIVLGGFCASRGWLLPGLGLFLVATPLAGTAQRLGRLRMWGSAQDSWLARLVAPVSAAALMALCYNVGTFAGWGCLALGAAAIGFQTALQREGRLPPSQVNIFLAEAKGMGWLLLPFAAAGHWAIGVGALAIYTAGSFFWAQHQMHRRNQD